MEHQARLPRTTPEAQGIPSAAVIGFLDAVRERQLELHSFMLLRRGQVAAEGWWAPYRPEYPHMLFSLSKSFTSTAIGFAEAEGLLSVNDPVIGFFPDEAPETVPDNLAAMEIRHLLMMGTGHAADVTGNVQKDDNWVRGFLQEPVEYAPGTHFAYNSAATYMLAAILQQVTGQSLLTYLKPRLFAPLGLSEGTWETCPRGIAAGGWGLSLTTEDIAKFGQLYLQRGEWQGERILPAAWVEKATGFQIGNDDGRANDWTQGYGYQFWRSRHGAYRGDGAFGQYCLVMPEQEAVLAITSGVADMQAVLDIVWDKLLPALSGSSLEPDESGQAELAERLKELRIDPLQAGTSSPNEAQLEGKVFHLEPNELELGTIGLRFAEQGAELVLGSSSRDDQAVRLGRGKWEAARICLGQVKQGAVQRVEGSFAWRDSDTLRIELMLVETPFTYVFECRLDGEALELQFSANVGWEPGKVLKIAGHAAAIA
ncbi:MULTISPECIES: serine hydrolase [unclassified Paenibacillus]|uniref:serine hydrolase domain-containing protein n=1 Tax=unclassified Paenibacillus TaxID=185978 RepID=UPI000953C0F5|nr:MULTISPECIES: serine hydrolase [unclassified Paenibacillus]ASS68659.1 serine hydrolase [Paenibacillus sp. RUD330]SIR55141.1 CubicO group peptidase, beta-lactamase class C family [Paenibacillus sp. RU4X]SIR63643.1 CubicO group peptidase, beta-lactamase class C family [Paenibacillus sp. RU4T]